MQADELPSLPVGTEVSAKYKGAFCEAKVKNVHRQVKCKVSFKQGMGSYTLCDSLMRVSPGFTLIMGCTVEAKHPEKGTELEAVVTKIYDQSQYTVVFDDGDIATLRRNALCMKSGKHFNASESLDNLPLTHPEHFGTPVGSKRKGRFGDDEEEEEEDDESTDDEAESVPYITRLGTVVRVEVSEKKSAKSKETWFPGLVVSPHAQDQVKINTKEDFLIRSFKDHRFYTVPKKECKKFHKDCGKHVKEDALAKAIEHALAYLANNESLPIHWDREILFDMRDDSSTEGSSEDEEILLSDDEDIQSPEEKDHMVAELYKHMDDRGTPINRTPNITGHDIDLYKLFRLVQKLGGHQRVTNNFQWKTVAKKLGFETNWCVNQVRVHYNRYLKSFEELYKQLGWTLVNHPRNTGIRSRHGSGRPLARGVRVGSKSKDEEDRSDRSSVSSQESEIATGLIKKEKAAIKEEIFDEIDLESGIKQKDLDMEKKNIRKNLNLVTDKIIKDEPIDEQEMEIVKGANKETKENQAKGGKKGLKEDNRMITRPRRDSSSSMTAATELKAKKEEVGEAGKCRKETTRKSESKRVKEEDDKSDSGSNSGKRVGDNKSKKIAKKKVGVGPQSPLPQKAEKMEEEEVGKVELNMEEEEVSSDLDSTCSQPLKKKGSKAVKGKGVRGKGSELAPVQAAGEDQEGEEPQHLKSNVECMPGDKIKVFWLHGQIYEAKIIKLDAKTKTVENTWPRYYVHYQGWNQRYDEWITRGRIAENLTWNSNPMKQKQQASVTTAKSSTPPPEKAKVEVITKVDNTLKKVREEDENQDETDEKIETDDEEEIVKELEATKKKGMFKARSSTPTSTPSTSRTNSPANNRRTKSPAPKRANSPVVKMEKTPKSEKKKNQQVKRTNSPALRKSPLLKRQSSRSSLYKPSEDEDEEEEDEDEEGTLRRSTRGEKEFKSEEKPKRGSPNGGSAARVMLEKLLDKVSHDQEEGEEDCEKDIKEKEISRSSARLESQKRPDTPSKGSGSSKTSDSEDLDPYVFQEPEPFTTPTKFDNTQKPLDKKYDAGQETEEKDKSFVMEEEMFDVQSVILTPVKSEENIQLVDKTESPEKVSTISEPIKTEVKSETCEDDFRLILSPVKENEAKDSESEEKPFQPKEVTNEIKMENLEDATENEDIPDSEIEKSGSSKTVLELPDRYATLFPHLAALRAGSTPPSMPLSETIQHMRDSPSVSSDSSASNKTLMTSAALIGNIVENSILKESESKLNKSEVEKNKSAVIEPEFKESDFKIDTDHSTEKNTTAKESLNLSPTKTRQTKKKSKKTRSLRNPTHKSREVVSDSDTDTEDEKTAAKTKPVIPRRKTIESQQAVDSVRAKQGSPLKRLTMDSEEEGGMKKRIKRRKLEEEEDSLVCEETIPGSPVHPSASEVSPCVPNKALQARVDEKSRDVVSQASARLEMPFATVPESVGQIKGGPVGGSLTPGIVRGNSPPGTPDSSASGDLNPLTIAEEPPVKEEPTLGSKSPGADSSEVDMESLSGRGKAGSEDSRLDVEFSSSSDTRLARGRRRGQPTTTDKQEVLELSKSPGAGGSKRKRKARVDSVGRGRGKGRGRNSSGMGRGGVIGRGQHQEDTDDSETKTEAGASDGVPRLDRLDNAALAALAAPKPNTTSKYNFYVQLKPEMDQATRISTLQSTLENLRKTYMCVKSDLSAIERRRKKIRRKERERSQQTPEVIA